MSQNDQALSTRRVIKAERAKVIAAWTDPERLARWWGPKGFTNEFKVCDIRPGGTWSFTMIGPQGANYKNESRFIEVTPERIVIEHLSGPPYTLTAEFRDLGKETEISWVQDFKDAATCDKVRAFAGPGNEQNLDRLEAEIARLA
jgi:uncharacterized protein YndB with AHSA1/START domain